MMSPNAEPTPSLEDFPNFDDVDSTTIDVAPDDFDETKVEDIEGCD